MDETWRLLGPVELHSAGREVDLGPAKQRAVLAVLLLTPGNTVGVDTLIDRVWADRSPRARNAAAPYITRLRRIIDRVAPDGRLGVLRYAAGGYRMDCDPELVDLHRARRLARAARVAGRAGDHRRESDLLGQALDGWQAAALAGLTGEWAARIRAALYGERSELLARRAEANLRLGRYAEVVDELRGPVAEDPTAEGLVGPLMTALAGSGRSADALDHYAAVRAAIADQLGTEPSARLHDLYLRILRNDPAITQPPRTAGREVVEIGDGGPGRVVPAQLPPDVRGFAGRGEHLVRLDGMLTRAGDEPTATVISAVSGTAGVGKTALALHWAHGVADRFPDGQLYVDLRGYNRDGRVMSSGEAVRAFLEALGVAPQRVPTDPEAQVALYRSLLAGRRMLVLLDNARDAEQVRPLLPGSPSTFVVITSRSRLIPLVAAQGAHPLTLDLLSAEEARELLVRRLGPARVAAEPEAVNEIMSACAGLPLALSVAAARAEQTTFPLASLAAELTEAGLDALDAGDPAGQVRMVLSWSYSALTEDAARLFRLLGLHPGPDISTAAVASLAGQSISEAHRLLNELMHASLLIQHIPGRFRLHDLLRAFAAGLAHEIELDDNRHAALTRLLDHYTHTAYTGDLLLRSNEDSVCLTLGDPASGTRPESLVEDNQAMAWFAADLPVLRAMLRHAAERGFDAQAWQLARTTDTFVSLQGRQQERLESWLTALGAAQRAGQAGAQAYAHKMLAHVTIGFGRLSEGRRHLRQAFALYVQAGDRIGQADVHRQLAKVYEREGRHDRSLDHARQALELYRAAGAGETKVACALNAIGWDLANLGQYTEARSHCEQALAVYQRLDHRFGQGMTSDSLGYIHDHLGDFAAAEEYYQNALVLFQEVGDRGNEAETLVRLGDARLCASRPEAAAAAWARAVAILTELEHPDAETVRAKLDGVGRPPERLGVAARERGVVPAQLPADVTAFTGRDDELAALDAALARRVAGDGRTVVISAVSGTAGVGKTALAVRWSHRVAGEFPDGQVYLNLRGYDPDQPMTVADALTRLLTAVGVPPTDIPVEVDERAARYRSQVAGRRLLIVLDNAATVDQVRPLLPGTASCAVVVTSRDSLAGLVARDGAHRLDLDLLPRADALTLLRRLIDARVDADPAAATALADQCARLPLALRVAAELAIARPHIPLADLVSELADQQRRLDLLDAAGGDPRTAVAAVFSWSVRHLPDDTARAFRVLGVHPGPDLDPYAAAALIGTGVRDAGRALESLARAHLVYRTGAGRYAMHDLLRAYACDLARQAGDEEHRAGLDRLLDYYVGTTAAAMDRLHPAESHVRPTVAPPATDAPVFADRGSALAWLDAERQTLAIVAAHAAANGRPGHTVTLSALLFRYLTAGYPTDALVIHGRAREAARLAGDRRGESTALHGLGGLHWQLGRYVEAIDHFQQALALARQVGYRMGEARALGNLGAVEAWLGRYLQAAEHCGESLALFRSDGDRIGMARATNNLGLVQQRLGRYRQAAARYAEALAHFRAVGDLHGEANTLTNLGDTEQRLGRTDTAADHYERALTLYRRLGDRAGEAWALDGAGTLATRLGQTDQAEARHREALGIFREVGDREGEVWTLNGLGEAAFAAGRPADALDHHRAALAAAPPGPLDQPARAHTGLGRANAVLGDTTRARCHFESALTILTELGTDTADEVRAFIAALTDTSALAYASGTR